MVTDPMQGIEEDVPFDFGAATTLTTACDSAASVIEGQRGSRGTWARTALKDFRGHFSELFAQNATTADGDAAELVTALRATATGARKLAGDARAEQTRRQNARAWKEKHDHRGLGGWFDDTFGDGDDCPIPKPTPTLSFNPPQPMSRPRPTPAPGSGGGGGGTSSARPSDLHSFSTGSNHANDALAGRPASTRSAYDHFVATCHWGTLSAVGVFVGFDKWLSANKNDARWANVVGDAFEKAGGEGAVSTLPNSAIHAGLTSAGVAEGRTDLSITMPSALGHPPTTGYANDPVNTSTGNFVETEVDLEFTDACDELGWRRSYNSVNDASASFGRGWSSWAEAGLRFSDEAAAFTMPDGRQLSFPRMGAGWGRARGENLWLARESISGEDRLVVSGNDGTRWVHAGTGRLLEFSAGEGRAITLSWDESRLVALTHARGRSITVEWGEEELAGQIVAVEASDGRRFTYAYDGDRLVSASGPLGTRRYEWNETGRIESVVDADGVVEVANIYDEHGRVVRQRSPFGRVTRFAYLPGRVTVVSDEDGTRANTWIADDLGRLVGVIDAHDERQSMAYDANGNKVLATDRSGSVVIHEYDQRGRQVREVSPDGGDVAFAYDDLERVVRVEVSSGSESGVDSVTTYEYAGFQRNPSVVTDPEGGVTALEWSDGLLSRLVDPVGVVVGFTHDEHGELVATTDAAGNTARLERDETGRVVAAVTPSGRRTRFVYDETSGLLGARVDPDGATWRYEYTTAGRRRVVIDPDGGRTEVEYADHGEESATIDPLGRAIRRTYDDLGFVAGAELPDGSRWEFAHDALGRLTESIDPEGGVSARAYDADGAPSAVTDPTGVQRDIRDAVDATSGRAFEVVSGSDSTRLAVDRLGRLVSETQPDGTTRLTRYDRCGRPVEVIDPAGGLTRLVRDPAGRVMTMVRPSGAEVGYTYDACGRLDTITDATGATSRRVYDADGRVIEQHLPTGEVASTRFDEVGRVVAVRIPGVGTTTYAYDAVGRVVETRDPANGRRRFRYDAAGQLVEATSANGGATGYAYDANGRCVAITHPDGGNTRREYDANNHVTAETDPLGRTTRAGYDAAGRQVWQLDPAGSRTEWGYDDQGRLVSTWVDGAQVSEIDRDVPGRRVRITDRSGPGGEVAVHELEWDARGLLVSRTRDGRGPRWDYDADGARTALTSPDGTRTSYARDAAGRLVGVTHPILGTTLIERDAAGRMVAAEAGGIRQRWSYDDGFLATHETSSPAGGRSQTRIVRDDDGRIEEVETAEGTLGQATRQTTSFSYDQARQLIASATTTAGRTETLGWRYDAAGRLVTESVDIDGSRASRALVYDVAGQLVATRVEGPEGAEDFATYSYDPVGRRTREDYADGSAREFAWSNTGWLAALTTTDRLGDVRRSDIVVDALGELARIEGPGGSVEVFTDSADPWQSLLAVGEEQIVRAGPFTGTTSADGSHSSGGSWAQPGWRDARATGPDPWSLPTDGMPELPGGPSRGFGVTPTGDLLIGGQDSDQGSALEWLGSRVYDPSTRGFLSVDPMEATTGAGWAANPYSYAGNDPLHALDPLGLHPVTDKELQAYNAHNGGFMDTAAGKWLKNNWEYVAAGAMVIGGAALMFVPGGQAFGMGLMSAGVDTALQKATTGHVNWGEVAVSGALGMVGGVGGGAASKMGMTGWKAAVAAGAIDGAWQGGAASGAGYVMGPGPHSVGGLVETMGVGTVTGAGGGAFVGGATHGLTHIPGRNLGDVAPTPHTPEPAALPSRPSSTRPDFVVDSNGTAIPTSRARLEQGFSDAGFPAHPTRSPGSEYTMPDGGKVRVMDPSGQMTARASFTNANGQPVDAFSGKPPQPPPGGTSAENKAYVRSRTHIELGP